MPLIRWVCLFVLWLYCMRCEGRGLLSRGPLLPACRCVLLDVFLHICPWYVSLECVSGMHLCMCPWMLVPGYVSVYMSLECVPGMCIWYASLWIYFSGLRARCSLLCA